MNLNALLELKPNLEQFAQRFDSCIKTRESQAHLRTYLGGQISPLDRKSVEPIALAADVPVRTLEEFLSIHRWDEDRVAQEMRKMIAQEHAHPEALGIIDGSGYPKKGKKTAGVSRQWCGQTGKVDNCVNLVHLGYAAADFHCLLASQLYLPESWAFDEERRKEARIFESMTFRTKPEIAVDLLGKAVADGIMMKWILADEEYGRSVTFRQGVVALGMDFLVEVPCDTLGWRKTFLPRPGVLKKMQKNHRLTQGKKGARRVDELWKRGGPAWESYRIKETEKGPEVWQARVSRFYPLENHEPGKDCRFIVAYQPRTGETKYFLSSAPEEIERETLLRVAFQRWHIERIFQDAKGEVGMGHFEARLYPAIKRHFIISALSFLFLARERQRLAKKTPLESVSGEESRGSTTGTWVITHAAQEEIETLGQRFHLPREAQETGSQESPEATYPSPPHGRNQLVAMPRLQGPTGCLAM